MVMQLYCTSLKIKQSRQVIIGQMGHSLIRE